MDFPGGDNMATGRQRLEELRRQARPVNTPTLPDLTPGKLALQQARRKLAELTPLQAQAPQDPKSISAGTRFVAQLTADPNARREFLETRFGKGNVQVDPESGQTFIRQDGEVRVLDPQGFRLADIPGDLADIAGEAVEALSSAAGAIGGGALAAPAGPAAALGGALAGSAAGAGLARAGIERAFEKATGIDANLPREVAQAAALGAAGEGVGRALGAGLRQAGRILSRVSPIRMRQFRDGIKSLSDSFSRLTGEGGETAVERSGNAAVVASKGIRSQIDGLRRQIDEGPTAELRAVLAEAGESGVVTPSNAAQVFDKWTKQFQNTRLGENSAKIVKTLQRQRDKLLSDGTPLSLEEFQNTLGELSASRRNQTPLVKALRNDPRGRAIANELYDALLKDLDDAAAAGQISEDLSSRLLEARQGIAQLHGQIRGIETKAVKEILGLAQDEEFSLIPQKILSAGKPGPKALKRISVLLEANDPAALEALRQGVFEGLVAKTSRGDVVDPARFAAAFDGVSGEKLSALFETSPAATRDLRELATLGNRLKTSQAITRGLGPFASSFSVLADIIAPEATDSLAATFARVLGKSSARKAALEAVRSQVTRGSVPPSVRAALIRQAAPFAVGAVSEERRPDDVVR